MAQFDDDDLEDYNSSEEPTPQEEEQLYQLTPLVEERLTEYTGFNQEDIREALWYNYLELEPAIKELKKKFKKKEQQQPKAAPKPPAKMSKIAALAKARASQRAMTTSSSASPSTTTTSTNTDNDKTSVSILDKLKENRPLGSQTTTTTPIQRKKHSLGALATLRNSTNTNINTKKEEKIDALPLKPLQPQPQPQQEDPQQTEQQQKKRKAEQEPVISLQQLSFPSPFSPTPTDSFSTVFAPTQRKKQQLKKLIDQQDLLYSVFIPTNKDLLAQLKQNFTKPSPDDVALNAQSAAFDIKKKIQDEQQLESKLAQLKITSTPKKTTLPRNKNLNIDDEISKRQLKPSTSFVVIGHVDAGKSTLTGRLLLDSNTISMSTYNKLKREAAKSGKSSFSLAWVMDQTLEERNRGVTIDICSSHFETPKSSFTIVDAPGHRDFVPNMISGVSQADVAVLVVDASTDAFESGFHLDGQTKEHTILARSLGISRLIVAINKMDNVDWDESRFEQITGLMSEFLRLTGWSKTQYSFVPCSGLTGVNVFTKPQESKLNQWYHGPTVLEALEGTEQPNREFQTPFVMQISELDSSRSEVMGRIDTGSIQPGETVIISPSSVAGLVDSIILKDGAEKQSSLALAGDNVTIKLKNTTLEDVRVGDVMSVVTHEVPSVTTFETRVVMFDMDKPLLVGMPFVLFRGNVQQPAKISKIVKVYDRTTGEVDLKKRKVKHLSAKQSAYVVIECERKLPLQLYKENKLMGRVVLRKDGRTIGAGVVEKI